MPMHSFHYPLHTGTRGYAVVCFRKIGLYGCPPLIESEPVCSSTTSATTADAAPSIAKSQITEYRFAGCYLGGSQTKLDVCSLLYVRSKVEALLDKLQFADSQDAALGKRSVYQSSRLQNADCRLMPAEQGR